MLLVLKHGVPGACPRSIFLGHAVQAIGNAHFFAKVHFYKVLFSLNMMFIPTKMTVFYHRIRHVQLADIIKTRGNKCLFSKGHIFTQNITEYKEYEYYKILFSRKSFKSFLIMPFEPRDIIFENSWLFVRPSQQRVFNLQKYKVCFPLLKHAGS